MAKSIDWYYHRKNCTTCTKMLNLLEARGISAKETVSANTVRFEPAEALALARKCQKVIAAKGKSVVELNLKKDQIDDETLLKHLIGPSGKMRAPVIRHGNTLLVGFHDNAFDTILG
jgi:arsenate reductase-like glutaredoxin family protein